MTSFHQIKKIIDKYPYILILLFSILAYAQTFLFGWVMLDDYGMIEEIVNLYPGLSSLPNCFTHEYASFYRPMQILTWALESFIGGTNPFIYHFINVIMHGLVSVTVYYMFKKLAYKHSTSLLIALLFSVHPLFTHAVAWIPSRGDLLLTLFGLLAFINFLKYKETCKISHLIIQTLFLLLALFSKETAAFIPIIMIIFTLINKEKLFKVHYIQLYISWFFSIGLWYIIRSNVVSGEIPSEVFGIAPLLSNLQIIPELIAKFFVPMNLSTLPGFSMVNTIIGLVFFTSLIVAVIAGFRLRRSYISFGLFWFLLFLLPALLFRLPHADIYYDYFEHRSYFASIGLFVFIAEVIRRFNKQEIKRVLNITAMALICVLFTLTTLNAMNYRNGVKFWLRGIKTNPERPMLYNGLALSLQREGKIELSEKTLLQSLKIDPNIFDTHNRLATLYFNNAQKEKALHHFHESYRLRPDIPQSSVNLAVVLREMQRFEDAAEILKNALRFDVNNITFYQNIIDNYKAAGKYDSAYKYLLIADSKGANIDINKFILDWSSYLSNQNNQTEAISLAQRVLERDASNTQALNQLGIYHAMSKNYQTALSYWEKALKINPKFLPALKNFYRFYMGNKMFDKALIYADLIEKAGGKVSGEELKRLRGRF